MVLNPLPAYMLYNYIACLSSLAFQFCTESFKSMVGVFVSHLGQYHSEEGLGEWVPLKDLFSPLSLAVKAREPILS